MSSPSLSSEYTKWLLTYIFCMHAWAFLLFQIFVCVCIIYRAEFNITITKSVIVIIYMHAWASIFWFKHILFFAFKYKWNSCQKHTCNGMKNVWNVFCSVFSPKSLLNTANPFDLWPHNVTFVILLRSIIMSLRFCRFSFNLRLFVTWNSLKTNRTLQYVWSAATEPCMSHRFDSQTKKKNHSMITTEKKDLKSV